MSRKHGYSIVGGVRYPNAWAEPGKVYLQVLCKLCEDRGVLYDDDGKPQEWCDCVTGEARRGLGQYGAPA